ncbi:hypothetical protein G6F46_008691 [Rhizopus delemar]|nr:hypothetical protein G6F43_008560 [Rhizopus delemar]KAG1541039.1 hypothetical protein G6F51_008152 [Rhizopus arrhizus]KAG1447772.1 hypothetical protein G6F55_010956 [Rhizopus delemar]KAG1489794.1 hypothetical protein G6F54_011183 [Rhizopus delemar]KAG1500403.1 hypothetical protein G6F53_011313 [Rhizopus delemar]
MEDNNTPEVPITCTAGCGFYGNKIYNNMCSKCFKELEKKNNDQKVETSKEEIEPVIKDSISHTINQPKEHQQEQTQPIQKNKGRCFTCRSKIPLSKQLTNKCRCELIFCDTHRFPDKHDCHYDHAKKDKDILAKNNPKLNDKPLGGNSFQRIE